MSDSYVAMGWISPGFVESKSAVTFVMQAVVEKRLRAVVSGTSARINRARTSMIEDFMRMYENKDTKVEWLFLVDTDMTLPIDALKTLLSVAEEQDRRMVGGLGYIWQSDTQRILPSIVMDTEETDKYGMIYHVPPPDEPRFIEAKATGAFCLLLHGSLLQEMRDAYPDRTYPWFDEIDRGHGKVVGPDFEFFDRAKEITGENPLIDTSVRCGHIKSWELTHEEAMKSYEIRGY
jgi:hypothetical protein